MITLFYFILIVTFLSANINKVVPFIISKLRYGQSGMHALQKDKVKTMLAELETISMSEEFAKHMKLQRKIVKEKEVLSKLSTEDGELIQKAISSITMILRIALGLTLTLTVLTNRSAVVAKLPELWLWPFQRLICWSSDVPGGITTPCWIIISSSVARAMSRLY